MVSKLENLFPEKGLFLGLDISASSTGIALVHNQKIVTGNITLPDERGLLAPVLKKEELKNDIVQLVAGREVELAVVESIFFGGFVESFSKLASLTYVVEELIVEERIRVNKLVRAQSTTWKSWLRPLIEGNKMLKGNQGKEMVRESMRVLGWSEDGKGSEDRLDALGMLTGYLLNGGVEEFHFKEKDLALGYVLENQKTLGPPDREIIYLKEQKLTVPKMLKLLECTPEKKFICKRSFLGFERERLKIENNSQAKGDEPLMFWLKGDLGRKSNEWVRG